MPVAVLTLQLEFELGLLRRDEAESRVVDLYVAHQWWEAQLCVGAVDFPVDDNLLNMYWRRQLVEGQMARIDHADSQKRIKPDLSIRGLGDPRVVAGGSSEGPRPVGTVENHALDGVAGIGDPGVQFGACNTHQAAGHVQPERSGIILDRPINLVAR